MVPMLAMGCQGATLATSGVVPETTRAIYDMVREGSLAQAREMQFRVTEFFDASLGAADFPGGFRAAVEHRGFNFGASRQPPDENQRIDRQRIGSLIEGLLADPAA